MEAVIATALCSVILVGLSSLFDLALKSMLATTAKVQATYLEEEGLEALRLLRDNGWSANIALEPSGVPFYLVFDSGAWQSTSTNNKIDNIFTREIVLADVYRDGAQDIVSTGGDLDPNTRKATVTVSFSERGVTIVKSLSTYLTNVFKN